MHPEETPTTSLRPGQVGYVACNMKESSEGQFIILHGKVDCHRVSLAHIGDTLHRVGAPVEPMPGFKPAKAMVCSTCSSWVWPQLNALGLRRRFPG
jgi:translation factor GUF1, mitochondrial